MHKMQGGVETLTRYSGKFSQGLFRNKQFQLMMNQDEREWLFRKVVNLQLIDPEGGWSQNSFINKSVIPITYKQELEKFREEQKGLNISFKSVDKKDTRKNKNEL